MQECETTGEGLCGQYQRRMLEIRGAFATGATGAATVAARAAAVDELIVGLWKQAVAETPAAGTRDCRAGGGRVRAEGAVSHTRM